MAKRGETTKQIIVSLPVHKRFLDFRVYNEPKEALLIKIMDMADKYKAFSNHHKKPKREV